MIMPTISEVLAVQRPGSQFVTSEVEKFFRFCTERQRIYVRRFVLKQPPPWTKDEILRRYAFCNVYRQLDAVSAYVIKHILQREEARRRDILFNLILFRLFNEPETFDAIGFTPVGKFNGEHVATLLLKRQANGERVFRAAYRGGTHRGGPGAKVRNLSAALEAIQPGMKSVARAVADAPDMGTAHAQIQRLPWVGGFIAYQVVLDLSYKFFDRWDLNAWVYPGPGALRR